MDGRTDIDMTARVSSYYNAPITVTLSRKKNNNAAAAIINTGAIEVAKRGGGNYD